MSILSTLLSLILLSSCVENAQELGENLSNVQKENVSSKIDPSTKFSGVPIRVVKNTAGLNGKCAQSNELILEIDESQVAQMLCKDHTFLSPSLTEGAVCDGGVSVSKFLVHSSEVLNCSQAKICGKAPSEVRVSQGKDGKILVVRYENLPWGCLGNLTYFHQDKQSESDSYRVIQINIPPPPCPFCPSSQEYTCESCTHESEPPVIRSVVATNPACGQVKVEVTATDSGSGIHGEGYSFDGGLTWQAENFKIFNTIDLLIDSKQIRVRDGFSNVREYVPTVSNTSTPCSCKIGETTVAHNASIKAYKINEAPCETACSNTGNWVTRYCYNGELSESDDFRFDSCTNLVCKNCALPWGGMVNHRESVIGYSASDVACSAECTSVSQTRTCFDGVLGGDLEFKKQSCEKRGCSCPLPWGGEVGDGSKIFAYKSKTVSCHNSCESERIERTCSNGVLSGDPVYNLPACTISPCRNCTVGGGTLNHGQSLRVAQVQTLACGETCDDRNSINTTCDDGALSPSLGPTYRFACQEKTNCNCRLPGTLGVLNHGAPPIDVYKIGSGVACGNSCNNNKTTLSCSGGVLSATGGATPSQFTFSTCTDRPCCPTLWGQEVMPGGFVQAYKNETLSCNDICVPQIRACQDDGTLSGDAIYNSQTCQKAPCLSCTLTIPGSSSITLKDGEELEVFTQSSATCPRSCQDYSKIIKCSGGSLDKTFQEGDSLICTDQVCTTGGGSPLHCSHPWASGIEQFRIPYSEPNSVANFSSMVYFSKRRIDPSSGEKCSDYSVLKFCDPLTGEMEIRSTDVGSLLDDPENYTYPLCEETSEVETPITYSASFVATPNCKNSLRDDYEACVVWKNPVASSLRNNLENWMLQNIQDGKSRQAAYAYAYQNMKVKLPRPDLPGTLIKDRVASVYFSQNPIFELNFDHFNYTGEKTAYLFDANDVTKKAEQLHAYYSINMIINLLKQSLGGVYSSNFSIVSHVPSYPNAAWAHEANTLILGENNLTHLAFSTEVIAHEYGHSNLMRASDDLLGLGGQDIACSYNSAQKCCRTMNGCMGAINEGIADLHAAFIYPENPKIGESYAGSPLGLASCGIRRDVEFNTLNVISAQVAYDSCGTGSYNGQSFSTKGQIHVMGTVYAAIWWEVYKAVKTLEATNPTYELSELLSLFRYHLAAFDKDDDFISAYSSIASLCDEFYEGRYKHLFRTAYTRRGLALPP